MAKIECAIFTKHCVEKKKKKENLSQLTVVSRGTQMWGQGAQKKFYTGNMLQTKTNNFIKPELGCNTFTVLSPLSQPWSADHHQRKWQNANVKKKFN